MVRSYTKSLYHLLNHYLKRFAVADIIYLNFKRKRMSVRLYHVLSISFNKYYLWKVLSGVSFIARNRRTQCITH